MSQNEQRDQWQDTYDMGRRHGYDAATAELLRILQDRMKAGEDILPLLPLIDELRERRPVALNDATDSEPHTGGTER